MKSIEDHIEFDKKKIEDPTVSSAARRHYKEEFQELRNFLCDRKYEIQCDKDIGCTFDYIKHIRWHWDLTEH